MKTDIKTTYTFETGDVCIRLVGAPGALREVRAFVRDVNDWWKQTNVDFGGFTDDEIKSRLTLDNDFFYLGNAVEKYYEDRA